MRPLYNAGIDWSRIGNTHFVHWYSHKADLVDSVSGFLGISFKDGTAGIAIATPEHRAGIEEALAAQGFDPLQLQRNGLYIPLDAADTLRLFMDHDRPDPQKFQEVVGSLISRASTSWGAVRAFGEMVAVLWNEGNRAGAIELEALWNDLAKLYSFALFCAYPKDSSLDEGFPSFNHVCAAHSLVIL